MGGCDLFECAGEGSDVGVGEVLGEVSLDAVSVVAAGVFERLCAFVGEDDENGAPVVFGAGAVDESCFFHAVDDSGEAAFAVEDPFGECVHRDALG